MASFDDRRNGVLVCERWMGCWGVEGSGKLGGGEVGGLEGWGVGC